jgi:4-amino-4-deoxy-L-arabinose transferase-like glycosyltransferase
MNPVLQYFRNLPKRQVVRPWALAVPILVLLVALPLLRPLRNRDEDKMSNNELSRLAQIQALAESHTQELVGTAFLPFLRAKNLAHPPETIELAKKVYSDKPPVLAVLLAGGYTVMQWFGLSFKENQALVIYLLTVLGAVVPVASSAGMIYRMGRLFELRRPWRTALALAVTFGSGLISYAVVINAHAPAAALVLGACACLVHLTVVKEPARTGAWLMASGFCAALAATIEPAAVVFLVGLMFVIVALRWRKRLRFGGAMLYLIGAVPPILLHAVLVVPLTGDLLPPTLHFEMSNNPRATAVGRDVDDDGVANNGLAHAIGAGTERAVIALIGSRGALSHYPVLIVGVLGIALVLRRHWPAATKTMAAVTLIGGSAIVLGAIVLPADWSAAMYGPRWFIVFMPLLLFWAGAWLRKQHHPLTWAVAAVLLIFSIGVSLLGTTAPFIRTAPGRYTAAAALRQLLHPVPPVPDQPVVASN